MDISTDELLEVLDEFKKWDYRSRRALWITVPIAMLITLIIIAAYIYTNFEAFGLVDMGAVFAAIIFEFMLLLFLIFINDRLKHCINSCLRVQMYVLLKKYEQASSAINTICSSELNIEDLKSALPKNPILKMEE